MDYTPYTYLLVRKDLTVPQQIVQSAHASLEAGHTYGEHSHLICCGVETEKALLSAANYLDANNILYSIFFEPDNNLRYTAICTEPLTGHERKPMKRFELLTELPS